MIRKKNLYSLEDYYEWRNGVGVENLILDESPKHFPCIICYGWGINTCSYIFVYEKDFI